MGYHKINAIPTTTTGAKHMNYITLMALTCMGLVALALLLTFNPFRY